MYAYLSVTGSLIPVGAQWGGGRSLQNSPMRESMHTHHGQNEKLTLGVRVCCYTGDISYMPDSLIGLFCSERPDNLCRPTALQQASKILSRWHGLGYHRASITLASRGSGHYHWVENVSLSGRPCSYETIYAKSYGPVCEHIYT